MNPWTVILLFVFQHCHITKTINLQSMFLKFKSCFHSFSRFIYLCIWHLSICKYLNLVHNDVCFKEQHYLVHNSSQNHCCPKLHSTARCQCRRFLNSPIDHSSWSRVARARYRSKWRISKCLELRTRSELFVRDSSRGDSDTIFISVVSICVLFGR